jgi:tetratricopeptide (TPR) repeat protein
LRRIWKQEPVIESNPQERRRYRRFNAPKGMLVAWQGAGKRNVSVAEEFSVGGVFLLAHEPLAVGTNAEFVFDVPGGSVRGRGVVRHARPGKGMGLQFMNMRAEDRARLSKFLLDLEKNQRRETAPPPSAWFTHDGQQPLDSGEIKSHHEMFMLLNKIYAARVTGKVQLVLGRVERQLFFDSGQLVFASSSDRQDSLGEMMLREGAISQTQFEEATQLVLTGQRFGSAIAEMGVCGVEEVTVWVQQQLVQITSAVLAYPSCRYYFFSELEKNVVPEIGIPVPLGKLLLEAVRRATDLPLDALAGNKELWIDLSPDPLLRFQAVGLNAHERAVLAAISRAVHVKELITQTGLPADQAARALYALMVLGKVVCVPAQAPGREEARGASAAAATTAPPAEKAAAEESEEEKDKKTFEAEIRNLLDLAEKGTYYDLLGVTATSPAIHVKEKFHGLARKFHPDKHMGRSEWVGLLQDLMGRLSLAYKTLVDEQKRAAYDKQLAAAGAFTLGHEKTEAQETVEDCLARAKECLRAHNFAGSILWLRQCVEMEPNSAKYHAILARSLAAVPQYRQDAVHHYQMAIELDEWNTSTYFQFGELYELMKLPWRAVPLYRKILEIDPAHSKALDRLAVLENKSEGEGKKSFVSRLFSRKA